MNGLLNQKNNKKRKQRIQNENQSNQRPSISSQPSSEHQKKYQKSKCDKSNKIKQKTKEQYRQKQQKSKVPYEHTESPLRDKSTPIQKSEIQSDDDYIKTPKKLPKKVITQNKRTKHKKSSLQQNQSDQSSNSSDSRSALPIVKKNKVKEKSKKKKKSKSPSMENIKIVQMMILCILISTVSTVMLASPKKNYPLVQQANQQQHNAILHVSTDNITSSIKFTLMHTEDYLDGWLFGLGSTKKASFKAKIILNYGYKLQEIKILEQDQQQQNQNKLIDTNSISNNMEIRMSKLDLLSYDIKQIKIYNKQNGWLNIWQFEDYQQIQKYIQENYLQKLSTQKLLLLEHQHNNKRERIVSDFIINQLESNNYFQWLMRRIDKVAGGLITGLLPKYKIIKEEETVDRQKVFDDQQIDDQQLHAWL